MDQPLSSIYSHYRKLILLVVAGLVMVLSFLWFLPGAYHAGDMDEYHVYSWREYKFSNLLDLYVLHNLDKPQGSNYVLGGIGLDYPALLSVLIRATAKIGVSDPVTRESYRSSTPPVHATPGNTNTPIGVASDPTAGPEIHGNPPAFLLVNYTLIFFFGLATVLLMTQVSHAKPWMFAASPILLLFAGYNWDTIPMAISLAGLLLLQRSVDKPNPGRSYNLWLEIAGFAALTIAIWFKLFPIAFLGAALIDRTRRRLWWPAGIGSSIFLALSLLINVPLMLINHTSWSFFLWFNSNRPVEPSSIWYLLFVTIGPGLPGRPDTTVAVNIMSFIIVAAGGLVIAALAWRSPRRDIVIPLGCFLLLWWFTFNKLYDPNFDLWLVFILALMGARAWLNASLISLSFVWYITAIGGLSLLTLGASGEMSHWYNTHIIVATIIWRLLVMGAMLVWLEWKLLKADVGVKEASGDKLEQTVTRPDGLELAHIGN